MIKVYCWYEKILRYTNNYYDAHFNNWINIIHFCFKVFFAILQLVGCIMLFFIINYLGKRFLTVMSVSINTILLIAFGLYIIAINHNYIQSTPWFPTMVLSGISLFGTSISTLPWMLISEIFPNK
jgi:hypothetical protein